MTWPIITIDGIISDLIQHHLIQFHIEMVDRIKIPSGWDVGTHSLFRNLGCCRGKLWIKPVV